MTVIRILWRHRALIAVLVKRDLDARYRASVLGFLWSLINPLLLLAVYAVVFTYIFSPRFPGGDPYPLFLFSGLLPWLFFSGAVLDGSATLIDNGPLLAKVMCPPELFPAVTVLWAVVPCFLTTGGAVFAISVLSVHYRDMRDLVGHLLNLLFFSSPIIYSLEGLQLPVMLHRVLILNPLASLVTVYRDAVFAGRVSSPQLWLTAYAVGVVSWWLGTRVFAAYRETVVEAV
jgi:ABC-type polysaccharide/polyol phosphate export permease